MIVSIHQPQFLPWLGYFDKIASSDIFILLDNVQFKKNEWQNRNKIRTPQGWQWLTVPVLHNFGQKISEVKINNQIKWKDNHLKTLELNYKKSPFFGKYFPFFEELYRQEWECLADINIFVIQKMVDLLGIKTKIVKSSDYQATEDNTQRLIDLCKLLKGDQYLSGEMGQTIWTWTSLPRIILKSWSKIISILFISSCGLARITKDLFLISRSLICFLIMGRTVSKFLKGKGNPRY